eukprot:CAMPEP_0198305846 /NCGR_PEP_ID=MMETSP1449-20131203/58117_1 /TAXON_ID=420275 /ORGANISM="Attheya septentrionalis, Strain CCMP2084" /LENGTH=1234 /DNA_ID=CAMNT_0044008387 /DNA_START=498 /DNA_END=4202 /DNA_ORIENTATION=+
MVSPVDMDSSGEGSIARVSFRVRCETLGHGEEVFLVRSDDANLSRMIPLYTTGTAYPWYRCRAPFAVVLPPADPGVSKDQIFSYRYAVFRAGVFYRWESSEDGPSDVRTLHHHSAQNLDMGPETMDVGTTGEAFLHHLPLRLLIRGELYTINDVLGVRDGTPDIEHIRVMQADTLHDLASLHSRDNSRNFSRNSKGSMRSLSSSPSQGTVRDQAMNSKKVGFAPPPTPYHHTDGSGIPATPIRQSVHLDSTDGLVVASAFLPVHLHRSDDGEWSADWDYEALLSMQTHLRVTRVGVVKWRGWHGNTKVEGSPEGGVPESEKYKVEMCLRPFNCVPVWVKPSLFGEMYNGFCKGVLWPVLHNVTSVYTSSRNNRSAEDDTPLPNSDGTDFSEYTQDDVAQGPIHGDGGREAALWAAYTAVNRQFADVIVQCFNEGDLVWIHGFHLLILPSFLTRKIPMAKMGIFLHTPFPSSEIFRTLWCREDLLRGMLNADQVGFHLFEYARHFLTCCRRLLGLNYGMIPDVSGGHSLAIDTNGRHVAVTSIHAGVEPPVLNQVLNHSSTLEKAFSIRNQFRGKVIFGAIDRMESLKGIPLKMLGLERFLHRCPEWVGKIVLVQVGISAFERGDDYFKTKEEVLGMVAKINRTWPGTVQFQECAESEMRLQQRMALLRASDIVMVTPIRDGLNLIPLEFTIAHQDAMTDQGRRDGRKRGLCILSEFSSCTRVMRGALHVNPWKISELANAFHIALTMSEDERARRISTASEFVTRVTTQRWALAVMLDLKGVHKNVDVGRYSGAGLGLGFRLLGMDKGFQSLDTGIVAKAYKNARSRLILVDYGGTILSNDNLDNLQRFQVVKKSRKPSLPTGRIISILKDMCADKRNTVFVVSGKERHSLTKTLNHIPNLGLAAEHGMFISWPTSKVEAKRRWETIVPDQDQSWRSIAITVMEVYTSRTHGSYIEETEMKVLWQYRDADPEFGQLQAKELEDHLANVLRSFGVDILHGGVEEGGYVEVRPKGVNKGVVAMHVIMNLQKATLRNKVDFALAMGDDHCDEPMLSVMRQIGRRASEGRRMKMGKGPLPPAPANLALVDVSACDESTAPELQVFTATVGKKPSAAAHYLNDVDEVHALLESLVRVTTRDHKYYSSIDLRGLTTGSGETKVADMSANATSMWNKSDSTWLTSTISSGVTRSMSMGVIQKQMTEPSLIPRAPTKVSANLNEFLGGIRDEEEEEEDDIFF